MVGNIFTKTLLFYLLSGQNFMSRMIISTYHVHSLLLSTLSALPHLCFKLPTMYETTLLNLVSIVFHFYYHLIFVFHIRHMNSLNISKFRINRAFIHVLYILHQYSKNKMLIVFEEFFVKMYIKK